MNARAAPLSAHATAQALTETEFSVPDIRCAGCIGKLENGLVLDPAIAAARVNFTAKRVKITHAPDAHIPDLVGAFALLGFEAHPIGKGPQGIEAAREDSAFLLRAVGVSGFAMMNIMLLSVSVWSGAGGVTKDLFHWLSALIALPTVAYAGRPFFASAWRALKVRTTNMDVPISIGVIITTALSLHETAIGAQHAYFDGVVMLLFFLLTGRWLDSVMRDRAREGVTSLLRNMGTGAYVLRPDGGTDWVDATVLTPGMVMLVAAGERLSADGVVVKGQSAIDLSLLNGESAPAPVAIDDRVHAGTLNIDAPIEVKVTAIGSDTVIADIARLMGEAAQSKSRYVRVADRASRLYAPAVHTLAALSFAGWMIAGAGWHDSLLIAVAVLIITCPCALGLAVPAAQIVTAGALMKIGVLVKDGSALERLAEVDTVLTDKTGTLTLGRPDVVNLSDLTPEQQSVALALAQASRHPLSEALARALGLRGIAPASVLDLSEQAGFGVSGLWHGKAVTLGRSDQAAGGALSTTLTIDGQTPVTLCFADQLRPDVHEALASLKSFGMDTAIISGDRMEAVAPIARDLGLFAQGGLSPQEKLDAIAARKAQGQHVLMLGDGLNDGPALAAGHASMAPGSASDAGKNAADFIIMGDRLSPVVLAIKAARRTQAIVRQNFMLAIGYNVIAVPLGIFGFVTPMIAAIAMSGSSLIVIANAMRLKGAAK